MDAGPYSDSDDSEAGLHFLPTVPEGEAELQSGDSNGEDEEDSKGEKRMGEDLLLPDGSKRKRVPNKLKS